MHCTSCNVHKNQANKRVRIRRTRYWFSISEVNRYDCLLFLLEDANHDLERNKSRSFLSRHRFKIVSFFHKIYIKPLHTFETSYFSSVIVKSLDFSNREMYRYSFQYGSNGIIWSITPLKQSRWPIFFYCIFLNRHW